MLPRLLPAAVLAALLLASPATARVIDSAAEPSFPPAVEPVFGLPLDGPLESRFGLRWGRLHAGLDIGVVSTDAVRAARRGRVTLAGWSDGFAGYGLTVRVGHGEGVATLYAHLASAAVEHGDWVERGDLLGRAGCTGSCTGQHLHFEVRVGGKPADPLGFIAEAERPLEWAAEGG